MRTKIVRLNLEANRRILFASDIHGNYKLFDELLKKVGFSNNDYLFILGDMIEKSDCNLETLDYFMELNQKDNVYILCGNCDNVLSYMIENVDDKKLKHYALGLKHTILLEFAKRLNIEINNDSNMEELCHLFYQEFRVYYDFVLDLPHAYIINDLICAVHGGISSLNNISNEALDLMKNDDFYEQKVNPEMIEIVGHYPVINYEHEIPSLNPIIDLKKKIISIDGGMSVLPWSQLNMLMIDNLNNLNFTFSYIDSYQAIRVIRSEYYKNQYLFNVTHSPIEIEAISEDDDFIIARYQKYQLYVLKKNIIKRDNKLFVYNAFNYFIDIEKDDVVSLVYKGDEFSIIKKNGVLGLCHTNCLEE